MAAAGGVGGAPGARQVAGRGVHGCGREGTWGGSKGGIENIGEQRRGEKKGVGSQEKEFS